MLAIARMVAVLVVLGLVAACSGDDLETGPDAGALQPCSDFPGCEHALCTDPGVCTCLRPGLEPVTCTNAADAGEGQ